MSDRYKVTHDIEHSCCYAAGIIDAQTPTTLYDGTVLRDYTRICECLDTETAELICKALNALPVKERL